MKIMRKMLIVLLVVICVSSTMLVKPTNAYDVGQVIGNMTGNGNVDANSVTTFTNLGDTILTFLQILVLY